MFRCLIKKTFANTILLSYLMVCPLFAQTLFKQSGATASAPPRLAQPSQVMSPDEFSKTVNSLNQQNQDKLSQTFKQQSSKGLAPPSRINTPPATIPPASAAGENATTNTPPPAANAVAPATQAPSPPQTNTAEPSYLQPPYESSSSNGNRNAPAFGNTQPPSQPQPYTGFGGSNSNPSNNTPSSPSQSGGWNIKY